MSVNNNGSKIETYYLMSDFLLAFMWLRIYFLVRAIFNYNIFTDVYSKKLCKSYGFTANVRFTFKSLLKTDPGLTVALTFGVSILVLAYLMRVVEVPYYSAINSLQFSSYFDAIWCVIITMTTVGYGDIFPATTFGRLVAMLCALWGTFLISLLILIAADVFALTTNEQKALHHLL